MRARRPVARLALASVALLAGCYGGDPQTLGTTASEIHQFCAARTEVRGIDVSQWQGAIQWSRLPGAGVRFAIIRLSNNMSLDTRFNENWAGARAAGVLRGAYHYFNPTTSATGQANFFVDRLLAQGFGDGDLPPMLDVEYANVDSNGDGVNDRPSVTGAAYQAAIRAWVNVIRARLGREPIIYTGGYYWDSWVQSAEWAANPLFHAEYPNYSTRRSWSDPVPNSGCARYVSNSWPRYTFWQYAGDNTLASSLGGAGTFGSTAVDMDVFDGTLADLQALAHVTPRLDARFVGQSTDAAPETDGSGQQFHVCTGQRIAFEFEVENTGSAAWLDAATMSDQWGRSVRLGTVPHDTPDPLNGLARVSLNTTANHDVRPDGGACNDRDGCRRARFTLTGTAPSAPGTVRTRWQLVDELRAWFGPEMWLSFHVVDCPRDAGVVDAGPRDAGASVDVPATRDVVAVDVSATRDVSAVDVATRDVSTVRDVGPVDAGATDLDARVTLDGAVDDEGELAFDATLHGSCDARPRGTRGGAWMVGLLAVAALSRRRVRRASRP
ncbi:MAG: GH25 family lysozyme [Polyangiales bacterium]